MTKAMKVLTPDEHRDLESLEVVVNETLSDFERCGRALLEIRDRDLYQGKVSKETGKLFTRFEDYCRETWGMSKAQAFRLLTSAEVARSLPMGDKPENERQARELGTVPEEERAEVMRKAKEGNGKPTAAKIREVIQKAQKGYKEPHPKTVARQAARDAVAWIEKALVGCQARWQEHLTDIAKRADKLADALLAVVHKSKKTKSH